MNISRFLHNKLYLLLFVLISISLVFSVLRPVVADVAFILLFLASIVCLFQTYKGASLFVFEKVLLVGCAFVGAFSIVSFIGVDSGEAARYRLEDDGKFLLLIPLYLLFLKVYLKQGHIFPLLLVTSAAFGVVSLIQTYGMFEYKEFWLRFDHTGRNFMYRPSGSVNPMRYAVISLIVSISVLAYVFINWSEGGKRFKTLCIVASILGLIACLLTQTRGVWLAVFALFLACMFVLFIKGYKKHVLLVAIFGFTGVLSLGQIDMVKKKVNTAIHQFEQYLDGKSGTSVGTRLDMYVVSWGLFKQSPVYGSGLNAFKTKTKEMRENGEFKGMSWELGVRHTPHNEFLMAAVEKGIIGIILVFGLFAIPFVIFYRALMYGSSREAKWYGACGAIMIIVLFVAGQTGTIFNHNVFTHFYIIWTFLFVSQIKHVAPEVLEWKKLKVKPL